MVARTHQIFQQLQRIGCQWRFGIRVKLGVRLLQMASNAQRSTLHHQWPFNRVSQAKALLASQGMFILHNAAQRQLGRPKRMHRRPGGQIEYNREVRLILDKHLQGFIGCGEFDLQ